MPKEIRKKPAYTLHKRSGQARVRIDGKDRYLGPYGSPESRDRYNDLVAGWLRKHGDAARYTLTCDDLALLYVAYADEFYRRPDGSPTGEAQLIRYAVRHLLRQYGRTRVRDFGPKMLKAVREQMIEAGHVRTGVNAMVARIKRMFKWGVSEEHVPASVHTALTTVTGLPKGRSAAAEPAPIQPVSLTAVEATLPHLCPVVRAMVQLQLLTGARPGEICLLRPCDISIGTDGVWTYRPAMHKTSYREKERRIFIGPRGQEILRPFLNREPESYCFCPAEAIAMQRAEQRKNRRSPMTPSQIARQQTPPKPRALKPRYTKDSLRRAVERACEAAFAMPTDLRNVARTVARTKDATDAERKAARARLCREAAEWRAAHVWSPNQLRHARATELRAKYDIEAAQVVLGHSDPRVTEVYAERNFQKAAGIMAQIG